MNLVIPQIILAFLVVPAAHYWFLMLRAAYRAGVKSAQREAAVASVLEIHAAVSAWEDRLPRGEWIEVDTTDSELRFWRVPTQGAPKILFSATAKSA